MLDPSIEKNLQENKILSSIYYHDIVFSWSFTQWFHKLKYVRRSRIALQYGLYTPADNRGAVRWPRPWNENSHSFPPAFIENILLDVKKYIVCLRTD